MGSLDIAIDQNINSTGNYYVGSMQKVSSLLGDSLNLVSIKRKL